jgi:hypothetical protein
MAAAFGSRPGIGAPQAAADREGETLLERVYGISRDPGCGTLLLYSPKSGDQDFELCF